MLRASGFRDCDPGNFITKWHSPEYPAGPSVFEELEKIYESHSPSVSERKLLFDLINLSIPEIYRPLMDPHPRLGPVALMFHLNWRKNPLQEILMRLVASHKKDGKEGLDRSLISHSEWLYLTGDIDLIELREGNTAAQTRSRNRILHRGLNRCNIAMQITKYAMAVTYIANSFLSSDELLRNALLLSASDAFCNLMLQTIIEQFQKCHSDHPLGMFFGECTDLEEVKLDRCFREEEVVKRKVE
ncbi:hypothetical protein MLD38_020263 [Melastoma candidum]|uniref:Uncharacterized protein n=1 Tax=Melastoma candidum TaxID=119954 RepID=A0ACB9QFE4_9MYRT|nr:hypothetical protein MLD38_020263 [Melastoma candidum]